MNADADKIQSLRMLGERLRASILGQDGAVAAVTKRLQHGELGLTPPGRPKASFLFLGPTGVGKTELALRFTEEIFGPGHLVRLDMSEYQTPDRLSLLLGSSDDNSGRICQGFDAAGGIGTLLFDEIEKAHPRILDILLQMLEPGRVTVGANRVLDFSGWYVVLTSNIGAQRIMAMRKSIYETMRRLVQADALRELRPEIFARISEVVVFDKLGYETQRQVARAMVTRELSRHTATGRMLKFENEALDVVVKQGYHDRLGARPMRDAVERLLRNALSEDIFNGGCGAGTLRAHVSGAELELLPAATVAQG